MTSDNYPIPADNIRFPEAITIRHGDARILSRFFIAADNMARSLGVELKFRNDFQALMRVNEAETAKGTWYRMFGVFDPDASLDLGPQTGFWLAGENEAGEIVATCCGRIFDWRNTNLAREIRLAFYGGRDVGQQCLVTAPLATDITGIVYYAVGVWVAPHLRGSGLSSLLPHAARAYAATRWPIECAFNLTQLKTLAKTDPSRYGYSDVSYSVKFPDYPTGCVEAAICRLRQDDMYADFARFAADWRDYVRLKQAA